MAEHRGGSISLKTVKSIRSCMDGKGGQHSGGNFKTIRNALLEAGKKGGQNESRRRP